LWCVISAIKNYLGSKFNSPILQFSNYPWFMYDRDVLSSRRTEKATTALGHLILRKALWIDSWVLLNKLLVTIRQYQHHLRLLRQLPFALLCFALNEQKGSFNCNSATLLALNWVKSRPDQHVL
jgi:hypothetical protein